MIQYVLRTLLWSLAALWSQQEKDTTWRVFLFPLGPLVLNVNLTLSLVWVLTLLRFLRCCGWESISFLHYWILGVCDRNGQWIVPVGLSGMFERAWPFPSSCFKWSSLVFEALSCSTSFLAYQVSLSSLRSKFSLRGRTPRSSFSSWSRSLVPSPDWLWDFMSTFHKECSLCVFMYVKERERDRLRCHFTRVIWQSLWIPV